MKKKHNKRVPKKLGDVVTFRLSPESGATQEIVDWINQADQISEDVIYSLKALMALEKRFTRREINAIIDGQRSVGKTVEGLQIENTSITKAVKNNEEKKVKEPAEKSNEIIDISNANPPKDKSEDNKKVSPGFKAFKSIAR